MMLSSREIEGRQCRYGPALEAALRPMQSGAMREPIVALVPSLTLYPDGSSHPVIASSVSTRTKSVSSVVQTLPRSLSAAHAGGRGSAAPSCQTQQSSLRWAAFRRKVSLTLSIKARRRACDVPEGRIDVL